MTKWQRTSEVAERRHKSSEGYERWHTPQKRLKIQPITSRFVTTHTITFCCYPIQGFPPRPSVWTISTDGSSRTRRVEHHCAKNQGPWNHQAKESIQIKTQYPPYRALPRQGTRALEPTSRRTKSTFNTRRVGNYCVNEQGP